MKYWGPMNSPGGVNGDDPYVNGDPVGGTQGSVPTFQFFEQILRELTNLVIKSGLTPDAIIDGIQVAQAVQRQNYNYAADTGTADALVVALDPIPDGLNIGFPLRVKKSAEANATSTPTLVITGSGVAAAVIKNASGGAVAAGDLSASSQLGMIFDGTNWILTSFAGSSKTIIDTAVAAMFNVKRTSFNGPTSGNWTAPANVAGNRIRVYMWGPGGGGGGCQANGKGGCGGNGGDYLEFETAVTPGNQYAYSVPAGGAGGSSGGAGTEASDTTFGGVAVAQGGRGGAAGTVLLPGDVGGDNAASTVPTNGRIMIGTRGSQGYNFANGPGGIGGSAGGGGGAGPSASGQGYVGGSPGGGGGGSGGDSGIPTSGGHGGPGRIVIEYATNS